MIDEHEQIERNIVREHMRRYPFDGVPVSYVDDCAYEMVKAGELMPLANVGQDEADDKEA